MAWLGCGAEFSAMNLPWLARFQLHCLFPAPLSISVLHLLTWDPQKITRECVGRVTKLRTFSFPFAVYTLRQKRWRRWLVVVGPVGGGVVVWGAGVTDTGTLSATGAGQARSLPRRSSHVSACPHCCFVTSAGPRLTDYLSPAWSQCPPTSIRR